MDLVLFTFIKNLVGKISFGSWVRIIGIVIALGSVAYCGYRLYNAILERGAAQQLTLDTPRIEKAEKAAKEAIANRDLYVGQYNTWLATTDKTNKELIAQQEKTIAELRTKAAELPALTQANERLKREIAKHIDAKVDAACVLPVGFIRLYNQSAQADAPAGRYPDVPERLAGNDAAPSGVACSTMAGILLDNTNEAVQRGRILTLWQTWYTENAANFDAAARAKAAAIPKE